MTSLPRLIRLTVAAAAFGAAAPAFAETSTFTTYAVKDGEKAESVTLQGSVAETFGNFFILQGGSGRALVDLGPGGGSHGGKIMAEGSPGSVLGRADSPTGT